MGTGTEAANAIGKRLRKANDVDADAQDLDQIEMEIAGNDAMMDVLLAHFSDAGFIYTKATEEGLVLWLSHLENQRVRVTKVLF